MRTPLRFAGFALVAAIAATTAVALLVLPGLATTTPGTPTAPASGSTAPAAPGAALDGHTTVVPAQVGSGEGTGGDATVSSPVLPFDPGYWTPERMAGAKPAPMPTAR